MQQNSHQTLTDNELYHLCQKYGGNARLWMRKFAGLLPEVWKRKLYKGKGYASIHEFAAKLAGMNHDTADRILRLGDRLKDKPILLSKLEGGSQGWSKIEAVSFVATPKSDRFWGEKVERLNRQSLGEYIKEYRKQNGLSSCGDPKLDSIAGDDEEQHTLISQVPEERFSLHLSADFEPKLRLLKQQIEKERQQTLGWNEVMNILIQAYGENKNLKKALMGKVVKMEVVKTELCENCIKQKMDEKEIKREVTRHIPAEVKKIIQKRSQKICEFPDCHRPGEIYHHTRRFALRKNHNPQFIVWLCKPHERLAHAGMIDHEENDPAQWKIRNFPDRNDVKFLIDENVRAYRNHTFSSTT